MNRRHLAAPAVLLALASLVAGCGDSRTSPTDATTTTTATPTAGTQTFTSSFNALEASSRLAVASQSGTLTVTLDRTGPPNDIVLGVGIGIPRNDGSSCFLNTAMTTAAGPGAPPSAAVDAGLYCVKVYDVGGARAIVSFSATIDHP